MVSSENPIEIKKEGRSFVKDVFVEIWTGPESNKDFIIGERYHATDENGPWVFSTRWMKIV